MPQDLTDDKSTLVQVMAWCRQATSHYLNQCWPISPTPYVVTRPQWVNERLSSVISMLALSDFRAIIWEYLPMVSRFLGILLKWCPYTVPRPDDSSTELHVYTVLLSYETTIFLNTQTDVLVKVSKLLRQKMSRPEGNPKLLWNLMGTVSQKYLYHQSQH